MTQFKFKIGDTVVRTHGGSDGLPVGETGTVTHIPRNGWPLVEGYGNWMHDPSTLSLVQDDPLPPAPESVLYMEEATPNTLTARARTDSLGIQLQVLTYYSGGSVVLSPDEVLQLCHDLRRMAMELKRKEKQDA